MKIVVGCDEAALFMKNSIKEMLINKGYEVTDFGVFNEKPSLYPNIAFAVAESISRGEYERGMLFCGTGIGMAICANKVPGIRAAVCHDPFSTERSRKSNDAQILTMGSRVIGIELAKYLVTLWLNCDFAGGGSTAKVEAIKKYESMVLK